MLPKKNVSMEENKTIPVVLIPGINNELWYTSRIACDETITRKTYKIPGIVWYCACFRLLARFTF